MATSAKRHKPDSDVPENECERLREQVAEMQKEIDRLDTQVHAQALVLHHYANTNERRAVYILKFNVVIWIPVGHDDYIDSTDCGCESDDEDCDEGETCSYRSYDAFNRMKKEVNRFDKTIVGKGNVCAFLTSDFFGEYLDKVLEGCSEGYAVNLRGHFKKATPDKLPTDCWVMASTDGHTIGYHFDYNIRGYWEKLVTETNWQRDNSGLQPLALLGKGV